MLIQTEGKIETKMVRIKVSKFFKIMILCVSVYLWVHAISQVIKTVDDLTKHNYDKYIGNNGTQTCLELFATFISKLDSLSEPVD